jgi:hypothetical protein
MIKNLVIFVNNKQTCEMGTDLKVFITNSNKAVCNSLPLTKVVPVNKIQVKSYLVKITHEELQSSRCSAYQYLIP